MPIATTGHSAGPTETEPKPEYAGTGPTTGVATTAPAGPSPAIDRALRLAYPIMMGLLLVLALAEFGIIVSLIAESGGYSDGLSRVYFALFCAIWTMILVPVYWYFFSRPSAVSSVLSHLVFVSLTFVFWLAAAAALTDWSNGAITCDSYYSNDSWLSFCRRYNATLGLAWVAWIVTLLLAVATIFGLVQSRRRGDGLGGTLVSV